MRMHDILGAELPITKMEAHALAEEEGPFLQVWAGLPAFGEGGVNAPLIGSTSSRVSQKGSNCRWSARPMVQKRLLSVNPAEAKIKHGTTAPDENAEVALGVVVCSAFAAVAQAAKNIARMGTSSNTVGFNARWRCIGPPLPAGYADFVPLEEPENIHELEPCKPST